MFTGLDFPLCLPVDFCDVCRFVCVYQSEFFIVFACIGFLLCFPDSEFCLPVYKFLFLPVY